MLPGYSPIVQSILGSLFTWGVTAIGASLVFFFRHENKKLLDSSLGFAAGVMTAASFWSLLAPALEITQERYEKLGFLPVAFGFVLGAFFVYGSEFLLTRYGLHGFCCGGGRTWRESDTADNETDETSPLPFGVNSNNNCCDEASVYYDQNSILNRNGLLTPVTPTNNDKASHFYDQYSRPSSEKLAPKNCKNTHLKVKHHSDGFKDFLCDQTESYGVFRTELKFRRKKANDDNSNEEDKTTACLETTFNTAEVKTVGVKTDKTFGYSRTTWKRIMLLILAITVHNIPEGLAVGVGFGAAGKSPKATFESARSLALGIGVQNFPEGFAVSLPLVGLGYSKLSSFFYGQLSGMVEPLAAVLGAALVSLVEPVLPYALSFAAGAMIFVVFDDIVPECHTPAVNVVDGSLAAEQGNEKLASWCAILGFVVMMSLDVGLG